jgi:hypothetical protein
VTHGQRKRVHLAAVTLEEDRPCQSCSIEIPIGDAAIVFDGGDDVAQARTFCVRCVSGVSIEAAGLRRFERRARPIWIRIRKRGTNEVVESIPLKGGTAVARRAFAGLAQRVDYGRFWIDGSELEEREQQKREPGKRKP